MVSLEEKRIWWGIGNGTLGEEVTDLLWIKMECSAEDKIRGKPVQESEGRWNAHVGKKAVCSGMRILELVSYKRILLEKLPVPAKV